MVKGGEAAAPGRQDQVEAGILQKANQNYSQVIVPGPKVHEKQRCHPLRHET